MKRWLLFTTAFLTLAAVTAADARDNSSAPSTPRANSAPDPRNGQTTYKPMQRAPAAPSGVVYVPHGNGYLVKRPGQPDLNCQPFGTTVQCK